LPSHQDEIDPSNGFLLSKIVKLLIESSFATTFFEE
jgi:hypothetical protein